MLTYTHRYELVLKPAWSYKDIMEWCEVSKATAIKIKKRAQAISEPIPYGNNLVLSDAVLYIYGTTREREIDLLRRLNDEKKLQEIPL